MVLKHMFIFPISAPKYVFYLQIMWLFNVHQYVLVCRGWGL